MPNVRTGFVPPADNTEDIGSGALRYASMITAFMGASAVMTSVDPKNANFVVTDKNVAAILCTTGAGGITGTLPTLADNVGAFLLFIKVDAGVGVLTLDGEGAETIAGALTNTDIKKQWDAILLFGTSTGWIIIARRCVTEICHHVDIKVPKRPIANPPGEGTEDGFPTLDFDDTQDESIFILYELPAQYYAAGKIDVELSWFVDTAPAGVESVVWGVEYKKLSEGDNFDFGAGSATITDTEVVTAGTPANDKKTHRTKFTLTTTGFALHDWLIIRLYRDADAVADDYTGDARLFSINMNIEAIMK